MKISILIMVIAVICITLVSPTTALENLSERITNGHFDQVTRTYEQLLLDEELGIFSPPWPEGWSWTDEGYSFMYWEPDNWSAYHSDCHATVGLLHDGERGGVYTTLDATGGQYVEITLGAAGNEVVGVYLDNVLIGTIAGADATVQFNISGEEWTSSSVLEFNSTGNEWTNSLVRSISLMASTVPSAPVANFYGSPTSGMAPLTVSFVDTSSNSPTTWLWDFGDDETSTDKNVSHQYTSPGTYTVNLTVTNAGGNDTETKVEYITVTAPTYYVYAESGDSGTAVYNMAKGFWETIKDAQSGSITWRDWRNENDIIRNDSAREGHWRKITATPSGHADQWVERGDFAYFTGHGFPNGFHFDEPDEDSNLVDAHAQNISLGSGRTKWAVIDSCLSLNESSWTNWNASFNGLRILMGWDTTTIPTSVPLGRGEIFAKLMMGQYPDPAAPELSILEAWTWAAKYTWVSYSSPEDKYTAIIYDTNCLNDKLPGWGGYSTSLSGSLAYNKTLVKNSSLGKDARKSIMLDSTNGIYAIHTLVPTKSDKLMTYISEQPEYTEEWVSSLAKELGLSGEIRESKKAYYADETEEDDFYFVVQKDDKIIAFKNYHQQPGDSFSAEKGTESVHGFLESTGLMFLDATEADIGYNIGESISPSGEAVQTWKQTVVTFSRELNGLEVWDSQILADVDSQGNIVGLFINWQDYKPYKEVSLKTPEQAFEEFQTEFTNIHEGKAEKVAVTSVSLGYSSMPISETQWYLQPTYVFEGYVQRGKVINEFEPIGIKANCEDFTVLHDRQI